jgi:chorismate synthase
MRVQGIPDPGKAGREEVVEARPLRQPWEYRACIELQRRTWGPGYREVVPASMLKVTQRMGGVVAGAFSREERLLGFVFGLTSRVQGRMVHWSHMLAVLPENRNRGIGRQLKAYQREAAGASGVEEIRWTFDPLVARNAHFNVTRLGVDIFDFIADMYGETGSELHRYGTDRLLARWPVAGEERAPAVSPEDAEAMPVLNVAPTERAPDAPLLDGRVTASLPVRIRVAIPSDIEELGRRSVTCARAWRESSRAAFEHALAGDYGVAGFVRGDQGRSHYVLQRVAEL